MAALDQSNFEACLQRIAAKGGAAARQARQILEQVHAEGERLSGQGVADPYVAAAQQLSDRVQAQARAERLDALRNATVRQTRIAEATREGVAGAADVLRGRLVWQPGSRDATGNVQTLARGLTHDWESAMFAQLQKAGLTKAIGAPAMFRDVAREVWAIKAGAGLPDAEGNPARRIAQIIAPVQEAIRQRLNRPGSVQDELVGALMQFKTWPVAALHQILGRQFYDSLTRREAAWGVGAVVGLSMLGGYLRMTARDLAYGDEPRIPQNIADAGKIALAALAQGGGLGIFGDFLFGEANRMGASNLSSVGGPVATDLDRLYRIYADWLSSIGTDRKGDAWAELARWGVDHMPFAGLFYLKGAANYLLWFHLFEAMHPGWWERTNRRMEREQGRAMLAYQPGAGVPWGVPGLYLASRGHPAGLLAGR